MPPTATTAAVGPDNDDKSIVRSVRFLPSQWLLIVRKTHELGVPVGRFLRNAALTVAGAPTESHSLRKLADALDGLPAAAKDAPARAIKPPAKARARR